MKSFRCGLTHSLTLTRKHTHTQTHPHMFMIGWKVMRASSGLVDRVRCCVDWLLSQLRGQGSTSSGMMVRMTSSLLRLTTVRSFSSRFMAALTSLAEVIRSPLMLMMTSLSFRPALLQRIQTSVGNTNPKGIWHHFWGCDDPGKLLIFYEGWFYTERDPEGSIDAPFLSIVQALLFLTLYSPFPTKPISSTCLSTITPPPILFLGAVTLKSVESVSFLL